MITDSPWEIFKNAGALIVLDGIDGTGKSTQVELLATVLRYNGYKVITSREPTDGEYGAKVRESSFTGRYSFDEELELFIKDREDHIVSKIIPFLMDGYIVILDRYYYSTIAYQGIRCDESMSIADLTSKVKGNLVLTPDISFMFDIDPAVAADRIGKRGEESNEFERLEDQIKIREIYNSFLHTEFNTVKIDADNTVDNIHEVIIGILRDSKLKPLTLKVN